MIGRRRAVSLTEALVAMSFMTVLLGVNVGIIRRAMMHQTEFQDRLERQTAIARIGRQFRADAHRSTSFHFVAKSQLELTVENQTVTYSWDAERHWLTRTTGSPSDISPTASNEPNEQASNEVRREVFELPADCRLTMDHQVEPAGPALIVTLSRPATTSDRTKPDTTNATPDSAPSPRRIAYIAPRLGFDLRMHSRRQQRSNVETAP